MNLRCIAGTADRHLQRPIQKYVSPGDTVYDIGANIGYVSLMLAKRVGPTGALFAFEPLPQNFARLKKNIALNGIYNATLLNVAVAAESGRAAMRATANLAMASMVWHCDDGSATEVRVETVAIDDLIESGKLPSPQFVKIDVEGAEGLVLQGMAHTIAHARPIILLECSDIGRQTAWPLLHGLKYRCQSTSNGDWIDAFEDYRHADFLWLPQEA